MKSSRLKFVACIISTTILLYAGCSNSNRNNSDTDLKSQKNEVISSGKPKQCGKQDIVYRATHFRQTSLSLGDDLELWGLSNCLDSLYANEQDIDFLDSLSNDMILRLYLYHLKRAHQGYDLMPELNKHGGSVVRHFLVRNGLIDEEYIVSGWSHELLKNDALIGNYSQDLVDSISIVKESIRFVLPKTSVD